MKFLSDYDKSCILVMLWARRKSSYL